MPKYIHANPKKQIQPNNIEDFVRFSSAPDWVKTLTIFLYYYGPRISEALMLSSKDFNIFRDRDKQEYLQVSTYTLKNPEHPIRELYVPYDLPCVDALYYYVKHTEGPVWPYSRQWCWVKLQEYFPELSPHVFRHHRLNEMAQDGKTAFDLKGWAGWSSVKPADAYTQAVSNLRTARTHFAKHLEAE